MKMIKAVLVDDERPALRGLEFLLKDYPKIDLIGMYTNASKAIDEIGRLKPQVVFLDINMPQMTGIDTASKILDLSPDTDIVFVTAFDQYAVEAFELHALDYILKPINPERLRKTVERVMSKNPQDEKRCGHTLQIKCLGRFEVAWENQDRIKWRTEKTRELFAFLLHNQGRDASKEELLDRLWPENDPDKAIRQLYNGIYYIRKALEEYGIARELICIDGSYRLKLGPVDFDVKRFYDLAKSDSLGSPESLETLERMEALYIGDYLEGEEYPWAYSQRENLRRLYQQCLIKLSQYYVEQKQFEKAESKLIIAYTKNPYEEMVTKLLLKLYKLTGETNKAHLHFNSYAQLLSQDLGIQVGARNLRN